MIRNQAATRTGTPARPNSRFGERRTLSTGQVVVDLWPFGLEPKSVGALSNYQKLLSPDELARAGRFRFRRDQRRYLVGRLVLRWILGTYIGSIPGDIRFDYGDQGKPRLVDHASVHFNLAHSEGSALLAVSLGHELGVDLERVRPEFADDHIAEHFFSPSEVEVLRRLPVPQQEQAFFECWTRKEAFLKAKGGGLSVPLDKFVVSFGPGRTAELLESQLDPTDTTRWKMRDVSGLLPGHIAAIVVDAGNLPVRLEAYPGEVETVAPWRER